jgi:hypothetical protein
MSKWKCIWTFPSPEMCIQNTSNNTFVNLFSSLPLPHPLLPLPFLGKWRIGFVVARAIESGDEVVCDYLVGGEDWSACSLIDGVVKPAARVEKRQGEQEAREDDAMKGDADEGFEVAMSRSTRHLACAIARWRDVPASHWLN